MKHTFRTKIGVKGEPTWVTVSYTTDDYDCIIAIDIEDDAGNVLDYDAAEWENGDIIDECINHLQALAV